MTTSVQQLLGLVDQPGQAPADLNPAIPANPAVPETPAATPAATPDPDVLEAPETPAATEPPECPQAEPDAGPVEGQQPNENPLLKAVHALKAENKGYKRSQRQLEQKLQELEARLTGQTGNAPTAEPQTVPTAPVVFNEPDPLDEYVQQNGGDADITYPASVQKRHDAWLMRKFQAEQSERDRQTTLRQQEQQAATQRQQQQQTEAQIVAKRNEVFNALAFSGGELSEEKLGEGLGLDDVAELAGDYLRANSAEVARLQQIERRHGPEAMWKATYESLIHSLKGTPEATELRRRVQAAYGHKNTPAPTAGPGTTTTPKTETNSNATKPTAAPTREEILVKPTDPGYNNLARLGFVQSSP